MSEIGRMALFGKLNPLLYQTLEQATGACRLRGNPYVELAHWLHRIFQQQDSDLHRVLARFDIQVAAVERGITASLDRLPRGAGSVSDLSAHIDEAVERAWVYATLKYDAASIRSAVLLLGIVKTPQLRNVLYAIAGEFERVVPDVLADELESIVAGSPEAPTLAASAGQSAVPRDGETALARYAVDLTAKARAAEIDPVVGRDAEIRQIIDILLRRRQNNPLLVGEAGVGKTAVAEGFALRIAAGDVPPPLRDVELHLLDIGLLQAGASVKGEFESRLRDVIDEAMSSEHNVILFIDEVHTLVGAGGPAGTGDAANLLKPALARGQLRTIGATTWSEYKQYIEKDPALTRRFQAVQVQEPEDAPALAMLRGLAAKLEQHHRVLVLDEALQAAVELSRRYIPARQLPDKAISLLDTACARVAVSQHSVPAAVEDVRRRIDSLRVERALVERERTLGLGDESRLATIDASIEGEATALAALEERWQAEREALTRIVAWRDQLLGVGSGVGDAASNAPSESERDSSRAEAQAQLDAELRDLATLQGETPLVLPAVDTHAVAAVVADWTGIPLGRMVRNEMQAVMRLADTLGERVIGQRHAVETIAERIQIARARLDDPVKPHGVFLLCGPSGVGKTETALALAETLYGGEHNVVTINMSEFQEAHTVSTLKGAPPGYVGYGQGGVLTEAVRRRPYSVVLLDEIEKAHRDVHEIFFQVFDKGWMEDGEGRFIDFRNTIIILTSNVGTERVMQLCRDPEHLPDAQTLADALRAPLLDVFPAALLGRLSVVPYYPLTDTMLARIVALQMHRIARRIEEHHRIKLHCAESAVALVVDRCRTVESGGRMVDAILNHTLLTRISREVLTAALEGRALAAIDVSAQDGEFVYRFEETGPNTHHHTRPA